MDYFTAAAAQQHPYFESTPEADSSSSGSPDNIYNSFRFGSINSEILPPDQIWDPVDLAAFDKVGDLDDPPFRQNSFAQSTDSEQTVVPPSKMRRRAQNRASQRAFRERKEKHVKGLETQLELLHEKHQDLLCSYNKQSDCIVKLNREIARLMTDLKGLKGSKGEGEESLRNVSGKGKAVVQDERTDAYDGGSTVGPDRFDAFGLASRSLTLYDDYDLGLDAPVLNAAKDATAVTGSSAEARARHLPDFEDLLRMP